LNCKFPETIHVLFRDSTTTCSPVTPSPIRCYSLAFKTTCMTIESSIRTMLTFKVNCRMSAPGPALQPRQRLLAEIRTCLPQSHEGIHYINPRRFTVFYVKALHH